MNSSLKARASLDEARKELARFYNAHFAGAHVWSGLVEAERVVMELLEDEKK